MGVAGAQGESLQAGQAPLGTCLIAAGGGDQRLRQAGASQPHQVQRGATGCAKNDAELLGIGIAIAQRPGLAEAHQPALQSLQRTGQGGDQGRRGLAIHGKAEQVGIGSAEAGLV
jgi:hypothetical protein